MIEGIWSRAIGGKPWAERDAALRERGERAKEVGQDLADGRAIPLNHACLSYAAGRSGKPMDGACLT